MRLPKDVVNRVFTLRFSPLNLSLTKAGFFKLFRRHGVPVNVIDPILWPDDMVDPHTVILTQS